MANLDLKNLRGIGPAILSKLNALGIFDLQDLCFHLPYGYQDRTKLSRISDLVPGDEAYIEGKIISSQAIYRPRKMLVVKIADQKSHINVRLFYFHPNQTKQFRSGYKIRCYGKTSLSRYGLEMIHPEYEISKDVFQNNETTLTPIYRITKGISQNKIRSFIKESLNRYDFVKDHVDLSVYDKNFNMEIKEALKIIHSPEPNINVEELVPGGSHPARVRLMKEEMIAFQVSMIDLKKKHKLTKANTCMKIGSWFKDFDDSFGYKLTNAQERTCKEIGDDLMISSPMMRLVQGDVGSGKTAVAIIAATKALDSGYQVGFMAPTTLLAQQHFENIQKYFPSHSHEIALLTSGMKKRERTSIIDRVRLGKINFLIGTHAIFQEDVKFQNLALVIIDEQHRFGVNQRLSFINKSKEKTLSAHQLTLTATPIPRTLSMSIYANMDISVIDEMPPGRKPIKTTMLSMQSKNKLISRLKKSCKEGSLAYWVCPLVEESEALDVSSVIETSDELREFFGEDRVGLIHGRMSKEDKDKEIDSFKNKQYFVLVSTTVIEVGVDIPDADIMVIENAERFGLAQLHQLRGRVGRGLKESHCILLHQHRLNTPSETRLNVLCNTNDGFVIAEKDLEIRGPGEIMGAQQTGVIPFKYTNLIRDSKYIAETKEIAETISKNNPMVAKKLSKRWVSGSIDYADA